MSFTAEEQREPHHKHRTSWMWADDREDLKPLKPKDFKLLQPKAAELGAELSDHLRKSQYVDYGKLCRKLGLSRKQIQNRLRRLRQAGLVEVEVLRHKTKVTYLGIWPATVSEWYGSQVFARPLASFYQVSAGVVVKAPEAFWEWKMKRKTHGGKRAGAGRKRKSSCPVGVPESVAKCLISEMADQSSCPVNSIEIVDVQRDAAFGTTYQSSAENAELPPGGHDDQQPAGKQTADQPPADRLNALFDEFEKQQGPTTTDVRRGPIPESERGPRPQIPPLDEPVKLVQGHPAIPEHVPPEARVQMVIDAYNAVARKLFGPKEPLLFGNSDPARSKLWPRLLAAADVLVEHEVSPHAWAEWCMAYAKKNGTRRGLTMVFSAKRITKRQGWFRHAYEDGGIGIRYKVERWHMEQYFRQREALLQWAWGQDDVPLTAPTWYLDMRRKERAQGHTDPIYMWSSPRGPGKGR